MYIINTDTLKKGDIILIKDESPESRRIRRASHSDYHHAMLYRSHASYIEADGTGVQAKNSQRKLFEQEDDVAVLRLKKTPPGDVIERILTDAGRKVGTEYTTEDAKRAVIFADRAAIVPNQQFCTRFVAQAYLSAGIEIVANADYCTPQQILESPQLILVANPLRKACQAEIDMAAEKNPATNVMEDATNNIIDAAKQFTGEDIQTLEQLTAYVIKHPAKEEEIVAIIKNSGYLTVWQIEEQQNPQQYNYDQFMAYFDHPLIGCVVAEELLFSAEEQIAFYLARLAQAKQTYREHPTTYFALFTELYTHLLNQMRKMQTMCLKVLEED
jgi:hypothetical protein